jgi:hypothetical protein
VVRVRAELVEIASARGRCTVALHSLTGAPGNGSEDHGEGGDGLDAAALAAVVASIP